MKKAKKFLLSLIVFICCASSSFATTTGTYVASQSNDVGKAILILIGILLIALVIFLGYKLDQKEEDQKRREKFIRNNENPEVPKKEDVQESKSAYDYNIRDNIDVVEDIKFDNVENNFDNEIENQILESAIAVDDLAEEMIQDEDINNYEENNFSYDVQEDNNTSTMNSTMVFDSNDVRENQVGIVKGYDFDKDNDDIDLLELEKTIKEANIKRYTRKKKKVEKKVKRFTRKKEQDVDNEDSNDISVKTEVVEKPKAKRGRPPKAKTDVVEKPKGKRGRPPKPKTDVVEKPKGKRGRPPKPKTDVVEKPKAKRGRPPKK